MISVDKDLCIGCGACVKTCPRMLFKIEDKKAVVDETECLECGHCGAVCPRDAITMDLNRAKLGEKLGDGPSFEDVEKVIHSRRSIRKFKKEAVDEKKILKLLSLASQTPTGSNRQGVGYLVSSPETTKELERLAKLEVPNANDYIQNSVARKKDGVTLGAPHIIAVYDFAEVGPFNAALAAHTIDLAAPAMDLGVCYNGILYMLYIQSEQMQKLFPAPEGKKVYMLISFGYSDEKYLRRVIRPDSPVSFL